MRAEYFATRLFAPRFMRRVEALLPGPAGPEREALLEEALLKAYDRRGFFRGDSEEALKRWVLRIATERVILERLPRRGTSAQPEGRRRRVGLLPEAGLEPRGTGT